jgi:hypothetical protein
MPCFLPDDTSAVLQAVFNNRSGRNPQLVDLDPAVALVTGGMLQIKELRTPEDVVVIEVSEADDIVVSAAIEVGLQALRQRDSLIKGVLVALLVGVVE